MDREMVDCMFCGEPTPMLGTKLCDRCFNITRFEEDDIPIIDKKLKLLGYRVVAEENDEYGKFVEEERFIEGDKCPYCQTNMKADWGEDASYSSPAIAPSVYCPECGVAYDMDLYRMADSDSEEGC